jgi:DNA-binding CsgD family transcriptional regulator
MTNPELTDREREILKLVKKGYSDREIASILEFKITYSTVRSHVRSIESKTGKKRKELKNS